MKHFFIAKNEEKHFAEILNPWSGGEAYESLHDDWNEFAKSDGKLIEEYIQIIKEKLNYQRPSWFLLWLPLRQKRHLLVNGKEVGSIISEVPGDDEKLHTFLFNRNLSQKLASLLPLLRRTDSVRFWHAKSTEIARSIFDVSLATDSSRVSSKKEADIRKIEGIVNYNNSNVKDAENAVIYK